MGVQISIIGGPTRHVTDECPCVWDGEAEKDCRWCDGTGVTSYDEPEFSMDLNLGNARAVFDAAGLDSEANEVTVAMLPAVRRRILGLMNSFARRATHLREEESSSSRVAKREDGLPSIGEDREVYWAGGLDDDGLLDRLRRLDAIMAKAQELDKDVRWS